MRGALYVAAAAAALFLILNTGCEEPNDDDDATPIGITGGGGGGTQITGGTDNPASKDAYLSALPEEHRDLVIALGSPDSSGAARDALAELGSGALASLQDAALLSSDPAVQGWAIEVIGRIEGESADQTLELIQGRTNTSQLVRTWAAAARGRRATTMEERAALAPLASSFPALNRPLGMKATTLVDAASSAGDLIALSQSVPALQQAMAEPILAKGAPALLDVMFDHADTNTRRTAAAYLGTLATRDSSVAATVADAYAFDPSSTEVMWAGGALYVPNLSWQQKEARVLVGHLVAWHVFCDRNGLSSEQQQVYNNLRSVQLHRPAGLPWPNQDTPGLLQQWAGVIGTPAVQAMLDAMGEGNNPRYKLPGGKVTR